MKVLHLCTYWKGGAANAAYRLHQGLLHNGVESVFGIKADCTAPAELKIAATSPLARLYANQASRMEFHFAKWSKPHVRPVLSGSLFPGICRSLIQKIKPDIINLHWVEHHFVTTHDLKWLVAKNFPIVWTLHDMSPSSGGFSYREEAGLPVVPYGPLTFEDKRRQVSQKLISQRREALTQARLAVVAPSSWLAEEARRSPVFEKHIVQNIPYGIDTSVFKPMNSEAARQKWGLPLDQRIILFGADAFAAPRKGIEHLKQALSYLDRSATPPLLIGFGNSCELESADFPIPVKGLGKILSLSDLASLYAAADVFVCPSREDNLPNTVIESLSCGTPVVGFEVGGIPDLVIAGKTGATAPCYDEAMLAGALNSILHLSPGQKMEMRSACRSHVETNLTLKKQADLYFDVYRDLLSMAPQAAGGGV